MPERSITPAHAPRTYAELRRGVEDVVFAGRAKIEHAWLRTYHDTGRLIHEHLLLHQEQADYGAKVFARLANDTGISKRVLYECVQLYRCFPIVRLTAQLTRTHYQLLCQVSDQKERDALTRQTIKEEWTVAELTSRVRAGNAAVAALLAPAADARIAGSDLAAAKRLTPKRGIVGLHAIVDRGGGKLAVDLGFKLYRSLTALETKRLDAGDIVRIDAEGFLHWEKQAAKADLFTYAVTVRRVIDGDTLVVAIRVTSELVLEEKLRLRGLDCPELNTAEGKAAKRFVEGLLATAGSIVIHTTKPDKYDRYLADVFAGGAAAAGEPAKMSVAAEIFLNNALLENGHAERKDAWEFGDWGME